MASSSSSSSSSSSLLVLLSTFAFVLLSVVTRCEAAAAAADAVAPGPTSGPLNLTGVLEKGGQYTTLLRLLKETQVGVQIQSQLNNSFDGLTIFAPTDNAFNNLKAGTLNSLTPPEQVSLVLYHVLPRYYSLSTFETTSNPVRTQASGSNGAYSVNITSTSSQVNVSTGVDVTQISNKLYSEFPLAVYSVDSVLLPYDIFGAKPPAAAPAPAPSTSTLEPKDKPAAKVIPTAKAKAPAATTSDDSTASPSPRVATCWASTALLAFVSVASLLS